MFSVVGVANTEVNNNMRTYKLFLSNMKLTLMKFLPLVVGAGCEVYEVLSEFVSGITSYKSLSSDGASDSKA